MRVLSNTSLGPSLMIVGVICISTYVILDSISDVKSVAASTPSAPKTVCVCPTAAPTTTPTTQAQTLAPALGPEVSVADTKKLHEDLMKFHRDEIARGAVPNTGLEGYSSNCGYKVEFHRMLVRQRLFQRPFLQVCEIGFNLGHSAITWLSAAPNVKLLSFDLGAHPYVKVGIEFVQKKFTKERFQIHLGDSAVTVPKFFKENPSFMCDIFMVDGGHSYDQATTDLNNVVDRINAEGILLIDDTNCEEGYCVDRAWQDFLKKNPDKFVPTATLEYRGPAHCRTGISGVYLPEKK